MPVFRSREGFASSRSNSGGACSLGYGIAGRRRIRGWWHPFDAVNAKSSVLHLQASWLAHSVSPAEFRRRAGIRWSKFWVLGEGTPHWDNARCQLPGRVRSFVRIHQPDHVERDDLRAHQPGMDGLHRSQRGNVSDRRMAGRRHARTLWPTWEQHVWTDVHSMTPTGRRRASCLVGAGLITIVLPFP